MKIFSKPAQATAFFRLKGHLPVSGNKTDEILQVYIRRANLDAFWSRRPGTIATNLNLFKRQVAVGEQFGFEMFRPRGPFPRNYDSGIRLAIGMLWETRQSGVHETTKKFSSCRKVRSVMSNMHNSSIEGVESNMVWRSDKQRFITMTSPSESEYATRFLTGCRARIGERVKRDAAITIPQMLALQRLFQREYDEAKEVDDMIAICKTCEIAVFFLLSFCCSMRGFELPKVVLHTLRLKCQFHDTTDTPAHLTVPLRGRFKARSQEISDLILYSVTETDSWLLPGLWVERLLDCLESLGITSGWLYQKSNGDPRTMNSFADDFYAHLLTIREEDPSLFEPDIDIMNDYGLSRSCRRGATTRATNANVSAADIDWINRWNTQHVISGPMRVVYAEQKQMMETYLRFSRAL